MSYKYLVFSADWEVEVSAEDSTEAVLRGTKSAYVTKGESFNIAESVIVVKEKSKANSFTMVYAFPTLAVMEDLGMYSKAAALKQFFKLRK